LTTSSGVTETLNQGENVAEGRVLARGGFVPPLNFESSINKYQGNKAFHV